MNVQNNNNVDLYSTTPGNNQIAWFFILRPPQIYSLHPLQQIMFVNIFSYFFAKFVML